MIDRGPAAGVAAALSLLAVAALLLVPAPPAERRVSWDDLIAPFGVGRAVTRGYVLGPPRRGDAHDVVYVARRDAGTHGSAGRVEVHVVDRGRWSGVLETRSFGVAWEVPPPGSTGAAPPEDAQAVTDALAGAIGKNDTGLASVDSIPLTSGSEEPRIARVLARLTGGRGALAGALVALALVLLASLRRGALAVGIVLFALGLALRAASPDVPFTHDQDVQRILTGNLPLLEIATGAGLRDRHPPLYFFVLHFAQWFGQSEAVGRAPAVLAGALAGPALLLAVAIMRGRVGPTPALAAFAVTISPDLVERSREVSEIPLFALLLVAASAALVAAAREPRPARLAAIVATHALAIFTYYLAPFIVAAHAVVLAWLRPRRRVVVAFAVGALAGAPALVLGLATLLRDWSSREVARAFPALAWGQHAPAQMVALMGRIAAEAFGLPLLVLIVVAAAAGFWRRDAAVVTPALGVMATCAGIALLSPIARVQGYYVTAVLPLAALVLANGEEPERPRLRFAWRAALVLAIGLSTVPLLATARSLYVADAGAFMPRFAAAIAARPERTVITVAHYDRTLLAYYLARADGRSIGWDGIDSAGAKRLEPLVFVHAMDAESEVAAERRLDELLAAGPALVLERDAFLLPVIAERLSACEPLLQAPSARLVRCPGAKLETRGY